ncbi:MAG: hypothetical protein ACLS7Z_11600 [Christensenellales bacterium]
MKFNLTREEMHDHLKVKKAALLSIAINVLEIIAGVVVMLLVRKVLLGGVEESIVRMVSLLCFTIVGWGALTDIGASLTSLRMVRRAGAGGNVFTARRPQPRDAPSGTT